MTNNIYSELHKGNLVDAFNMLATKIGSLGNWQLQQDLEAARSTYATMLDYMVKGVEDPESTKIRKDIIRQAYALNDRANIDIRLRKSASDRYCITLRQCRSELFNLNEVQTALQTTGRQMAELGTEQSGRPSKDQHELEQLAAQHDTLQQSLFNHIWTSDLWTKSEYAQYADLMTDPTLTTADKAQVVSAVTLASFELFDPQKLMLLMDAYLDINADISQRAIIGLLLLLIRYDKRMEHYTAITARFSLYMENRQFVTDCFQALINLQYSKMTDTVSAKMVNDIMPAILKSPRFKKSSVIELGDELTKNGENPEWLHTDDDDNDMKAEAKIRQMTEMQMDGADVYLSSFRHLKAFPFFHTIHHWLCPFSLNYPDILAVRRKLKGDVLAVVDTMLSHAPFCDSDKFSFISMLDSVPQSGHDMIASQIRSQLEESGLDEETMAEHKKHERSNKAVQRSYVADLYRLFKVYPYHTQLFDPFNKQLNNFSPIHTATLRPLLSHHKETLTLAEFMMRKGQYGDALLLFNELGPVEREADADLWQKMGFCEQKMGHADMALRIYTMAHRLAPNSMWTIQHTAQTAFDARQYDTAIHFIDLVLDSEPDNVKWLSLKVECMFAKEQYDTCMPLLHKLAYIDEKSSRTKQMLAWGLLMTRQYTKAQRIYAELKATKPTAQNTADLALTYIADGDTTTALSMYSEAYALSKDIEEFRKAFWQSADYFDRMDIDRGYMQLVYDATIMKDALTT